MLLEDDCHALYSRFAVRWRINCRRTVESGQESEKGRARGRARGRHRGLTARPETPPHKQLSGVTGRPPHTCRKVSTPPLARWRRDHQHSARTARQPAHGTATNSAVRCLTPRRTTSRSGGRQRNRLPVTGTARSTLPRIALQQATHTKSQRLAPRPLAPLPRQRAARSVRRRARTT
eukprot:365808-Chlamydomonas_euryale.AAC.11